MVSPVRFPTARAGGFPPELEMTVGGLELVGTSVAARATAFAVPHLGVALDVGRLSPTIAAQPVLLLSHAHLDHLSAVLAYLNVRARFHTGERTTLHCPREVADPLRRALEIMPGMEAVRRRLDLRTVIRGAGPGDRVELAGGSARAFAVDHTVPTVGWALTCGGDARPALVYASDGTTEPFRAAPELLDAGAAVVECTFLARNRRVAARLARHAHLLDWIELAPRLRCDHLVLAHLPPLPAAEIEALVEPLAAALPGRLVAWSEPA